MGFTDWLRNRSKESRIEPVTGISDSSSKAVDKSGYFQIYVNEKDKALREALKGEVIQDKVKFPKELGVVKPFDMAVPEGLYKNFGFVTAVTDKHLDFVIGPGIYVKSENKNAETIITQWIRDIGFTHILRLWLKEAFVKGTGFLEISSSPNDLSVAVRDAKHIWINRDKKGKVIGYNQHTGGLKRFNTNNIIPFKTTEMTHLPFNFIGDCPYGLGLVHPANNLIDNYLGNLKESQELLRRKANVPIWAKMGNDSIRPRPSDIAAFGQKLEDLNNKHEWVTGPEVEMSVLDFGNVGDKFATALKNDIQQLIFAFQIPEVILGSGNIPEGLAKVQMDAWERRIRSIQESTEKVVEEQVFKRILQLNGIEAHVEMFWGEPSNLQKLEKLETLKKYLELFNLDSRLRFRIEQDVATTLEYDDDLLVTPEEERKEEEEDIDQPEVPGVKNPKEKIDSWPLCTCDESHSMNCGCEENSKHRELHEWLGFNYQKFLQDIVEFTRTDKFETVKAHTLEELKAGRLSSKQIDKLRTVMEEGYVKGKSLRDIAKEVEKKVKPNDLFQIDKETGLIATGKDGLPKLAVSAKFRPIQITRSESTRLAAEGSLNNYEKGRVERVKFVAAAGSRTCPDCESLYGRIFEINDARGILPLHPNCRCSYIPITELN